MSDKLYDKAGEYVCPAYIEEGKIALIKAIAEAEGEAYIQLEEAAMLLKEDLSVASDR